MSDVKDLQVKLNPSPRSKPPIPEKPFSPQPTSEAKKLTSTGQPKTPKSTPARPPPPTRPKTPKPKQDQPVFSISQGADGPDVQLNVSRLSQRGNETPDFLKDSNSSSGKQKRKSSLKKSESQKPADGKRVSKTTSFLNKFRRKSKDEPESTVKSTFYIKSPQVDIDNKRLSALSNSSSSGSNSISGFASLSPTTSLPPKLAGEGSLKRQDSPQAKPKPPVPVKKLTTAVTSKEKEGSNLPTDKERFEPHTKDGRVNNVEKNEVERQDKGSTREITTGKTDASQDIKNQNKLVKPDGSPIPPARRKKSPREQVCGTKTNSKEALQNGETNHPSDKPVEQPVGKPGKLTETTGNDGPVQNSLLRQYAKDKAKDRVSRTSTRMQSQISFTTEDADVFQKKSPNFAENSVEEGGGKAGVRRSQSMTHLFFGVTLKPVQEKSPKVKKSGTGPIGRPKVAPPPPPRAGPDTLPKSENKLQLDISSAQHYGYDNSQTPTVLQEDNSSSSSSLGDSSYEDVLTPPGKHYSVPYEDVELKKGKTIETSVPSMKKKKLQFQKNKTLEISVTTGYKPEIVSPQHYSIPYEDVPLKADNLVGSGDNMGTDKKKVPPPLPSKDHKSAGQEDKQPRNSISSDGVPGTPIYKPTGDFYTEAELNALATPVTPHEHAFFADDNNLYEEMEFLGVAEKGKYKKRDASVRKNSSAKDVRLEKLKKQLLAPVQNKLEKKMSRKLTRKESRKLTRKLTEKIKENRLPKWRKYLESSEFMDDELIVEGNDLDLDELCFSESDSETGPMDSDSDSEFEAELFERIISGQPPQEKSIDEAILEGLPKTQRIAMELLSTEKAYVERLKLLDQTFHMGIVLHNRQHKMFPDDVIPHMFSNIKSIYQFHHDFLLPMLKERMDVWANTPRIGDVMKKFAPFLKLYSEYVSNLDHASQTINTWREKSPKFNDLVKELERRPECKQLALPHHMLEPVQRVPRYELLLKDYTKHLPEDSEDLTDSKAALEIVTKAAIRSNEIMGQSEKFRKLIDLNEKFGGTVNLISPTRELIKEGKIIKVAARSGALQERYIYVFNDLVLLCQTLPVTLGLVEQQKVKAVLEVDGMVVEEGDNLETPNTFYIKAKQKTLELHTETLEEQMEWQIAIWDVIRLFLRRKQTLSSDGGLMDPRGTKLGRTAPKWIKDQDTSQCMICGIQFKLLNRRHHCRACGKVVCGACSSHKAFLPYSERMGRVCKHCFKSLSLAQSADDISDPKLVSRPTQRRKGVLNVNANDPAVISGYLHMSLDTKAWHRRYFAVHKDFVLYSFRAHQDIKAMTSLPLPGYKVEVATSKDELDRDNVFKLSHPQQPKVYYFQAEDKNVIGRWFFTLSSVVQAELPPH